MLLVCLRSASSKLARNVLCTDIWSGGVLIWFQCDPHFMRISYTFDDVLYFGGTGKSDHRSLLSVHSLRIIIAVVMVKIKWLQFRILSGDNCVCSRGWQNDYDVVFPFVIVGVSELMDVAPPGLVEGGFGGSHPETVEMACNGVEFSCCLCGWRYGDKA